jgi:drug/metabolite transporter (DMT)-like permease
MQYWALARVDSSVVAFFIYLQPVIATTLSVVLLHERPGFAVLCGGALIFLGVYLALRPRLRAVRG